jgi:hypothetical protein
MGRENRYDVNELTRKAFGSEPLARVRPIGFLQIQNIRAIQRFCLPYQGNPAIASVNAEQKTRMKVSNWVRIWIRIYGGLTLLFTGVLARNIDTVRLSISTDKLRHTVIRVCLKLHICDVT